MVMMDYVLIKYDHLFNFIQKYTFQIEGILYLTPFWNEISLES